MQHQYSTTLGLFVISKQHYCLSFSSLLTLLRDKYPDCNGFYDHVGGKNIRFDARRDNTTFTDSNGNPLKGQFTLDGGQTWIDEFPITKNFIFYPVKLPEQQTV